jgi:aminoglycoside phosphotransferase (APT) family kinase protein
MAPAPEGAGGERREESARQGGTQRWVARLVSRHLPSVSVRSVSWLGAGLDNASWLVNGELIVRLGKQDNSARRAGAVRREGELLRIVAQASPLPVPSPRFVDANAGVLAYRALPGTPLFTHPAPTAPRLAEVLGVFVDAIHRLPISAVAALVDRDTDPLDAWLAEAAEGYRAIEPVIPAHARPLVEDFLGQTPPTEPDRLVFCHNDLGSEHILVDDSGSRITGIIDWSDAALADPARDFALSLRDFGPAFLDAMVARYSLGFGRADRERAVFYARCKLIEDIAYGLTGGDPRYAEAGLARLAEAFA